VKFIDPAVVEIAGFDFVIVDAEYGAYFYRNGSRSYSGY
jgi:hypothetical protein